MRKLIDVGVDLHAQRLGSIAATDVWPKLRDVYISGNAHKWSYWVWICLKLFRCRTEAGNTSAFVVLRTADAPVSSAFRHFVGIALVLAIPTLYFSVHEDRFCWKRRLFITSRRTLEDWELMDEDMLSWILWDSKLIEWDQPRGRKRASHTVQSQGPLQSLMESLWRECSCTTSLRKAWPAISDIWLGVRTVPVLSVAKEVAAPARSPTGRGAPEHGQVDADWLIDDRVSRNFWVLSVCWCFLVF